MGHKINGTVKEPNQDSECRPPGSLVGAHTHPHTSKFEKKISIIYFDTIIASSFCISIRHLSFLRHSFLSFANFFFGGAGDTTSQHVYEQTVLSQ